MAPPVAKVPAKRRRKILTVPRKVELVQRMEKGENRAKLMAEFDVSSSTLYDLKKQKAQLLSFVSTTDAPTSKIEKRKTLKKPKFADLDRALYMWFTSQRSEGKAVSGPLILEKARKLRSDLGIQEECNFSQGWLRNFKARHGIRQLFVAGERRSADTEAANLYTEEFARLVQQENVSPHQIYNADETALFWRCLPRSTLASYEEKEAVGFKLNKERITVLPCANVSGAHKVKLLVLGKFKKPRAFKNVVHFPVHYDATCNAWMTAKIFKWWFFNVFVVEVKNNLRKLNMPEDSKVILILDNCRAHPPAKELVCGNIFVVYLPPNVTSLIQPMDQGIIQNFKHFYRAGFLRKLINADCNVPQFQKSFNLKDAVFAAALAWKDVKQSTIRNCWNKLWPVNVFDNASSDEEEFEGFVQASSQVEELRKLASHAPTSHPIRNVASDDIEEWLDVDVEEPVVEEMTDEAIVEAIRSPTRIPEQESDEEEEERGPKVSWREAQTGLENFLSFVETSSHYNSADVMNLHILYNTFLKKKASSCKQADIREMFARAARVASPLPGGSGSQDHASSDSDSDNPDSPQAMTSESE